MRRLRGWLLRLAIRSGFMADDETSARLAEIDREIIDREHGIVARGNHLTGYDGVMLDHEGELYRCRHRHPTTAEARDCARRWARDRDIDSPTRLW